MCLIVAKPRGVPIPSKKNLKKWFNTYPDGFGVAFQYDGRVRILKGAMSIKQMHKILQQVGELCVDNGAGVDMVMQYRQAFTGSVCPEYCHPFPVTSSQTALDSLDVVSDCALAHNGVIWEYNSRYTKKQTDINDAQEFIKDYLVPMGSSIWNKGVQDLIESYTDSKFALLTAKGITYIGDFIEENGYFYSNGGYKGNKYIAGDYGSYKDYLYEPYESGGILCTLCGEYSSFMYQIEDDDSLVCSICFAQLIGRAPREDEREY